MRFSRFRRILSSLRGGFIPAASSALGHGPRKALIATTSESEKSALLGYRSTPCSFKAAYFSFNIIRQSACVSFLSDIIPRLKLKSASLSVPKNDKKAQQSNVDTAKKLLYRQINGCTFHIQKCCGVNLRPFTLSGEYSDLKRTRLLFNYGNDGCDGFSPNFPLIRESSHRHMLALRTGLRNCIQLI